MGVKVGGVETQESYRRLDSGSVDQGFVRRSTAAGKKNKTGVE